MKFNRLFAAALFGIFSTSALADRVVTDQLDRQVTIPDHIQRAVVLQHQTLNIAVQLDATKQIVGVLSNWKKQLGQNYVRLAPELEKMAMPGDLNSVNIESLLELKRKYDAQELKTDEPIVLITINNEYEKLKKDIRSGNIPEADRHKEIYERTRKYWKIGNRREKAKYAVAVYRGWTLAVYEIERWISADDIIQGRWMFEGKPLPKESDIYQEIVDKLTYSSQENYKAPQNPITYRNC